MNRVDLNSDVGESYGVYELGMDPAIISRVSSVNIACGWHAGDPMVMDRTVRLAVADGTAIGAHPGYPDRMGFGRRSMGVTPEEAKAYVLYQVGALDAFVRARGGKLQHVKAHGALYHMAAVDPRVAEAVAQAVRSFDPDLVLVGLSGSQLIEAGMAAGIRVAHEVFADRGYKPDGTLVPRHQPGAVIQNPEKALQQILKMVREGKAVAVTGETFPIRADTVCVHGDHPEALDFVRQLKEGLAAHQIFVAPLAEFLAPQPGRAER